MSDDIIKEEPLKEEELVVIDPPMKPSIEPLKLEDDENVDDDNKTEEVFVTKFNSELDCLITRLKTYRDLVEVYNLRITDLNLRINNSMEEISEFDKLTDDEKVRWTNEQLQKIAQMRVGLNDMMVELSIATTSLDGADNMFRKYAKDFFTILCYTYLLEHGEKENTKNKFLISLIKELKLEARLIEFIIDYKDKFLPNFIVVQSIYENLCNLENDFMMTNQKYISDNIDSSKIEK